MPIAFVAFLDGVAALCTNRHGFVRQYARLAPALVALVGVALLPFFSFWRLTDPAFNRASPRVEAARHVLAEIPDGASVAASNYLAAQLTDRCRVTLFADVHRRPVDWVVVDSTRLGGVPAPAAVQRARLDAVPSEGFTLVRGQDGILLFRRN